MVPKIDKTDHVDILHVSGPEGSSLYINNYRVAGPKPWGGGRIIKEWKGVSVQEILRAIGRGE